MIRRLRLAAASAGVNGGLLAPIRLKGPFLGAASAGVKGARLAAIRPRGPFLGASGITGTAGATGATFVSKAVEDPRPCPTV